MDKETYIKQFRTIKGKEYAVYNLNEDLSKKSYFDIYTFFEVQKNSNVGNQTHSHDVYLLSLCLSGKGVHIVDNKKYEIKSNRMFVLNPKQTHSLENLEGVNSVVIAFNEHFFSLLQSRLGEHIKYDMFMRVGGCMYCDLPEPSLPALNDILDRMKQEKERQADTCQPYVLAALFTELIMLTERVGKWSQNVGRNISSSSYNTYLNFIALVENEFMNEREVNWYANKLGVSVVLLTNYVKKYDPNPDHPSTPHRIICKRLKVEADRMLMHSKNSISEVAYKLGFEDTSNFVKFLSNTMMIVALRLNLEME